MSFSYKVTVNYILSRNGGRYLRIHVIGARKLTLVSVSQEYELQFV